MEVSHETVLLAATLLLFVTQAQAVSTNFFIFFDENNGEPFQHTDWSGIYTITDGKLTAFSAVIGQCQMSVIFCTYNNLLANFNPNPDPGGPFDPNGGLISAFPNNRLSYTPGLRIWVTVNDHDSTFLRTGTYAVAATPEPSALWLLLAGFVALISSRKFSSNDTRRNTKANGRACAPVR